MILNSIQKSVMLLNADRIAVEEYQVLENTAQDNFLQQQLLSSR